MKKVNLAIVGATGMVGRTFLKVLEERHFPINNLYLFASSKSKGSIIKFEDKKYTIEELNENSFKRDIDIALFSAGGEISKKYAPIAKQNNVIVIDNSSAWRMCKEVPLIVPEVNPYDIDWHNKIISNPNCSTIQCVVPLKPLHDKFNIKRIVYSTYQAVSGSGIGGIIDLDNGIKGLPNKKYPHQIAFNCLPHVDIFTDNESPHKYSKEEIEIGCIEEDTENKKGYSKEEMKMINETKKILNDYSIKITATTARIPVKYSHSISINLEFTKPFQIEEIFKLLNNSKGIVVRDDLKNNIYPMPLDVEGKDEVYVGRIRRDFSIENGLNIWVVADNVRKGAATNAVQIAELIVAKIVQ